METLLPLNGRRRKVWNKFRKIRAPAPRVRLKWWWVASTIRNLHSTHGTLYVLRVKCWRHAKYVLLVWRIMHWKHAKIEATAHSFEGVKNKFTNCSMLHYVIIEKSYRQFTTKLCLRQLLLRYLHFGKPKYCWGMLHAISKKFQRSRKIYLGDAYQQEGESVSTYPRRPKAETLA